MNLFPPLTAEIRSILDSVPALIEKTFPLPYRHRSGLPADVAELSRLLTSGRGERSASYLGRPNLLSAYLRCFFPWNLYRLCRLLPALPLRLEAGDAVTDLGAGPLTFAAALWIARPDLRELPLEFRCLDQTSAVLEAGLKFFGVLSGKDKNASCPWKIKAIRGPIDGTRIYGKPAKLVSAVNVFNELIQGIPHAVSLAETAKKRVGFLSPLLDREGGVLVVEPGVPRSGEFIAALRTAFLEAGRYPLAPCVHSAACPLPGNKRQNTSPGQDEINASPRKSSRMTTKRCHVTPKWCHVTPKWCHFAFATGDAPEALRKLSAAAGLPKDRATLSFLFAGAFQDRATGAGVNSRGQNISDEKQCRLRIISDSFPAGPSQGRYAQAVEDGVVQPTSLRSPTEGRYACGEQGLVLVKGPAAGTPESGGLLLCDAPFDPERDPRSGALVYTGIFRKLQIYEQ